jgi:hypothetical protein
MLWGASSSGEASPTVASLTSTVVASTAVASMAPSFAESGTDASRMSMGSWNPQMAAQLDALIATAVTPRIARRDAKPIVPKASRLRREIAPLIAPLAG